MDRSERRVAREELAADVVRRAMSEQEAMLVMQRWARCVGLPVARRLQACRQRREATASAALADAIDIVRREHAAGKIQRGWRSAHQRRAAAV